MKISKCKSLVSAILACALLVSVIFGCCGTASAQAYEVEIISLPVGYGVYNMGVGLAEVINRNSKKVHATHIEGKSPDVTMRMLITEPERRKKTIFFSDSWANYMGKKQIGVLKGIEYDYDKFKGLFLLSFSPNIFATVNPKLRSVEDLKGKKVVLSSTPGGVVHVVVGGILKEVGVLDTLKLEWMKPNEAKEALKDGLIDAALFGISLQTLPNKYKCAPALIELVSTKDTYFLNIPAQYIERFGKKEGCLVKPTQILAQMLGPKQEEVVTVGKYTFWAVHEDMPDEVVQEILRVVHQNIGEFKRYDPMGEILNPNTMARMGLTEREIHPAAARYYKKNNIPIGDLVK